VTGSGLIGVTGATGELGGRVARRLAARGAPQRLVVRDAGRAPQLEGAEVATTTGYGDRESMRAALDGVQTLFLVPGMESLDRIEQHKTAVDAAIDAGVEQIVYMSFVGATPDNTFTLGRHHWATEEHIRERGVPFTFPRMNLYMDFIPFFAGDDGVIRGPAGDGRVAAVMRDDLADVVTEILVDPAAHVGGTYELTGPESLTLAEIAETLTRVGGKPVRFENETVEEAWESRRSSGAPDWMIEGWVSSYVAIANGELDVVTGEVERIAGHPPVRLEDWLRARAAGPTSP
jgi:NAD(P)H dehydrogenase (quinone)